MVSCFLTRVPKQLNAGKDYSFQQIEIKQLDIHMQKNMVEFHIQKLTQNRSET